MKIKHITTILCIGALAFSCNRSKINLAEDDFYLPPETVGTEYTTSEATQSNFDALPIAKSISNEEFIPDIVSFNFDQSSITPNQEQILQAQVKFIKNNILDIGKIVIAGHCDQRGTIAYNFALGARRANVVKEYFVKNGIPENIIQTISYGKETILVPGDKEEFYKQNRAARISLCESEYC